MLAGQLIRVTHFKDVDITRNHVVKYKSNQDKTLKLDEEKSQNVYVKLIVSEQCGNVECVQPSSNSHNNQAPKRFALDSASDLYFLDEEPPDPAHSNTGSPPPQRFVRRLKNLFFIHSPSFDPRGMFSYDAYVLVYHLRNG